MSSTSTLLSLLVYHPSTIPHLCGGPQAGEHVPFIHYLSGDFLLE